MYERGDKVWHQEQVREVLAYDEVENTVALYDPSSTATYQTRVHNVKPYIEVAIGTNHMTRQNILDEALKIVSQDRNLDYGSPEDNFKDIAKLWETYTGKSFTPADVAVMMILVKVSRLKTSPGKRDHWVDIAGYASCGGQAYDSNISDRE